MKENHKNSIKYSEEEDENILIDRS
jgi:hypothetical protein